MPQHAESIFVSKTTYPTDLKFELHICANILNTNAVRRRLYFSGALIFFYENRRIYCSNYSLSIHVRNACIGHSVWSEKIPKYRHFFRIESCGHSDIEIHIRRDLCELNKQNLSNTNHRNNLQTYIRVSTNSQSTLTFRNYHFSFKMSKL